MSRSVLQPLVAVLAVAAIATVGMAEQQEIPPQAWAQLIDQQGNAVGEATFSTSDDGAVRIRIQVRGLAAAGEGERGLHIHEVGSCELPDFESAGDHFNPTGAEHGLLHPDGPHAGDLPNMVFDADGNADFEVLTMRVTLGEGERSLLGGDGTSVIIHINPDDHVEGNTEDRIACGVIEAGEPGGEDTPGEPGEEELPGEPGDAEYEVPDEPGGEDVPGEPGEEELPGEPGDEEYEVPGEPGGEETPGGPGSEEMPGEPGEEELPGEPGGAEAPGEPGGAAAEPVPGGDIAALPLEWAGGDVHATEHFEVEGAFELLVGAWCFAGVSFVTVTVHDADSGEAVADVTVIGEGTVAEVLDLDAGAYYLEVTSPDMEHYTWEVVAQPPSQL